ncbi:MAG: hypothetical protein ABJE95_08055 [Byssovorax sp.]
MKTTLEQRLQTLESEHQAGQSMLAELDDKRQKLTQTLLRIEGAMAVLRELLAGDTGEKTP